MFCGECGAPNPDTNQFCRNCGKPLAQRQQAAQPAVQPSYRPAPVPDAVPVVQLSPAPASIPGAALKRQRNWLGIASLVLGILSWIILTSLFAAAAILLGAAGIYRFRKTTGRFGISGIIGIIFGITAIAMMFLLA